MMRFKSLGFALVLVAVLSLGFVGSAVATDDPDCGPNCETVEIDGNSNSNTGTAGPVFSSNAWGTQGATDNNDDPNSDSDDLLPGVRPAPTDPAPEDPCADELNTMAEAQAVANRLANQVGNRSSYTKKEYAVIQARYLVAFGAYDAARTAWLDCESAK